MDNKKRYVDNLEIGYLIAFKHDGKIKSGKVLETGPSIIKIEEYSGQLLYIEKDDIIWVKTGKRWPKGIYKELRGDSFVSKHK